MDNSPLHYQDSDACRRWKHDLRNAANSTQLALDVACRMMATGNLPGAEMNLLRAREAFGILTTLLNPSAAPLRN